MNFQRYRPVSPLARCLSRGDMRVSPFQMRELNKSLRKSFSRSPMHTRGSPVPHVPGSPLRKSRVPKMAMAYGQRGMAEQMAQWNYLQRPPQYVVSEREIYQAEQNMNPKKLRFSVYQNKENESPRFKEEHGHVSRVKSGYQGYQQPFPHPPHYGPRQHWGEPVYSQYPQEHFHGYPGMHQRQPRQQPYPPPQHQHHSYPQQHPQPHPPYPQQPSHPSQHPSQHSSQHPSQHPLPHPSQHSQQQPHPSHWPQPGFKQQAPMVEYQSSPRFRQQPPGANEHIASEWIHDTQKFKVDIPPVQKQPVRRSVQPSQQEEYCDDCEECKAERLANQRQQ